MNRTATIEKLVSTTGAYMVVDIAPVLCVTPTICLLKRCTKNWLTLAALGLVNFASASQAQVQKTVLVINQFGQSAPVSVLISNQLRAAVHSDGRFQVQFYWENLDAADLSDDSLNVQRALIAQRYLGQHLDLIVLVGPDVAHFLTDKSKPFYPGSLSFSVAVLQVNLGNPSLIPDLLDRGYSSTRRKQWMLPFVYYPRLAMSLS